MREKFEQIAPNFDLEVEDSILDLEGDRLELVARLSWDSGGPGGGAGDVNIYRFACMYFAINDVLAGGPFLEFDQAVRYIGLFDVNEATNRIRVDLQF